MPWSRFMDEITAAGYAWTELGPWGYLPCDHAVLATELDRRGLRVCGSFVMDHLEDVDAWPGIERAVRNAGSLLAQLNAEYLVIIDDVYSDPWTGERRREANLDAAGWGRLVNAVTRICRIVRKDYGITGVFHPHAETHVEYPEDLERFLDDTDPEIVGVCLDTGHYAYRYGDPVALMRQHHDRIPYLHLKSVDATLRDDVNRGDVSFAEAVARDMFVEPAQGVIDFREFRDVLQEVSYKGFAIVEQDMYPAPFDKPLPIARRTRQYLKDIGMG